MKTYQFTLKFSLPVAENDMDGLVERLGDAGCDDALIGVGKPGRIALDFEREAESAFDAITSAIASIKKVVPEAKLVEATGAEGVIGSQMIEGIANQAENITQVQQLVTPRI